MLLERHIKPRMPIGVTEAGRGSIAGEVRYAMGVPVGTVGSPLKHVAVINDGRRPGQRPPPVEALELWVRRKVRIERGDRSRNTQSTPTEAEARGIAYAIARAIGARGIEGQHMFESGIDAAWPALQQVFAQAGLEITRDLTKGGG